MQKKQFLWKILALIGLAVIAGAIVLLYVFVLKPQPVEGVKKVELLFRVEEEETLEERRFEVETDANYLGEVLKALNAEYSLGMTDAEIEAGFLQQMLGVTAPADGSKYFYYYTTNSALYDTEGEYFGGYVSYDGASYGAPDYGVNDATLADGTNYLFVYTFWGQYGEDKPVPVLTAESVSAEVWLSDEAKSFDKRDADAKSLLITVCCVVGAAFVALSALLVVEAVKAKKQ